MIHYTEITERVVHATRHCWVGCHATHAHTHMRHQNAPRRGRGSRVSCCCSARICASVGWLRLLVAGWHTQPSATHVRRSRRVRQLVGVCPMRSRRGAHPTAHKPHRPPGRGRGAAQSSRSTGASSSSSSSIDTCAAPARVSRGAAADPWAGRAHLEAGGAVVRLLVLVHVELLVLVHLLHQVARRRLLGRHLRAPLRLALCAQRLRSDEKSC